MFQQVTTLGAYGGPNPLSFYGAQLMSNISFQLGLAGPVSPAFTPPLPTQQCHATDQGVAVVVQVLDGAGNPVNLRTATSIKIITVRPSGVSVETAAVFATNGLDGRMQLTTGQSSPYGTGLDQVGTWQVQGRITVGGSTQFTSVGAFSVYRNLGA